MKKTICLAAILAVNVALFIGSASAQENGWKLVKEKESIKIYQKKVDEYEIKLVKGVVVIDEPVEVVAHVIGDVEAQPEWMANVEKVRVVEKVKWKKGDPELTLIAYCMADSPWPVQDRDMVLKVNVKWYEDFGMFKITCNSLKDHGKYVPVNEDYLRMTESDANFFLESDLNDRNKTEVTYVTMINPAGWIPTWATNLSVFIQYDTLVGLRNAAEKKKYKDKAKKTFKGKQYIDNFYSRVFNNDKKKQEVIEGRKKIRLN